MQGVRVKVTVTHILVTKEKLACVTVDGAIQRWEECVEVGLVERWGLRGIEGGFKNQLNEYFQLKLK